MMSLTFTVNPSLFSKLPYDTVKDLTPVTMVASAPLMLVVHPSLPVKSVQEFIAYAKANPGKLNFGSGGPGTTPHLAGEMLKTMAGLQMTHVPYKGGAPALADLVGGQIQFMCENIPGTLPFAKAGKLRALAVTDLKRSPLLPELPTLDEAGLKGYQIVGWNGSVRSRRHAAGHRQQTACRSRPRAGAARREGAAFDHGRGRRRRHAAAFRRVHQGRDPEVGASRQGCRTQGGMMNDMTRRLAQFIVDSRWSGIPKEVRHEAKRALLNWLGCALGGCNDAAVDTALGALREFAGPPQATVLGRRERLDILNAALVNGIGSNILDFDDTHLRTVIHPTVPVAAAIIALAEHRPVTGAQFLHAFILGVETECRIGIAVTPEHYDIGWHITATCGVFGAAAACGKLLQLNEQQMTWALGIAATQASGLTSMLGSMCKPYNMGHAARNGLAAALLAQKEFYEFGARHRSAARVCARAVVALRPRRHRRRTRQQLGAHAERLQALSLRHRRASLYRRLPAVAQRAPRSRRMPSSGSNSRCTRSC